MIVDLAAFDLYAFVDTLRKEVAPPAPVRVKG